MAFTIEQTSALELIIEVDEDQTINVGDEDQTIIEIQPGDLKQVGTPKLVRKPKFKEDREEWLAVFRGRVEEGAIEVHVTYSLGMDGHDVEGVEVVDFPDGMTVHREPEFETRACDDDDSDFDD